MKAIINAELIMHDHFIPGAVILIEDGKIAGFGPMSKTEIPEGAEIIDAEGEYVGPGFIDIHVHAGNKVRFSEDLIPPVKFHLSHGVTTILPTPSYQFPKEVYLDVFKKVREAMKTPDGASIGGIYMEAPYTNPDFGSNREKNPWNKGVEPEDYKPLVDAGKDLVKVWCVAPERPDLEPFIQYAKAANPDVKFAVGHSEAAPEDIEKYMKYGLCIGTHHTNATGDRPRYSETRGVCVDECVNRNREIYAELICDRLGIHVCPYMLRLVRSIKGDDRIILISDQSYCDGPVPEGYEEATDIWFDHAGEISGSAITLDGACRNMIKHTGCSLVDAFNYASYNPAHLLGFNDRGEIAIGKKADLVIIDGHVNIKKVFLNGNEVK